MTWCRRPNYSRRRTFCGWICNSGIRTCTSGGWRDISSRTWRYWYISSPSSTRGYSTGVFLNWSLKGRDCSSLTRTSQSSYLGTRMICHVVWVWTTPWSFFLPQPRHLHCRGWQVPTITASPGSPFHKLWRWRKNNNASSTLWRPALGFPADTREPR